MHHFFLRTGMLQNWAQKVGRWCGVPLVSGTFANRTSRMSLTPSCPQTGNVCVCLRFCLLRSLSTPADQKGIRQLPCPNNAFNLGYVCLAIVWPPHVGSDDNKVGTRFSPNGFSAPRSRRSGRLTPPRQTGCSLPLVPPGRTGGEET